MSNVQCGHQPAQVTPTSDIPISWIFPCHARPDTQTAATARYLFIADIPLSCTSGCNRYRTWAECCTAGVGLVDIGLKWSHWISDPGLAAALSSLVCVCSSPIKAFHRFFLTYLLTVCCKITKLWNENRVFASLLMFVVFPANPTNPSPKAYGLHLAVLVFPTTLLSDPIVFPMEDSLSRLLLRCFLLFMWFLLEEAFFPIPVK